MADPEILLAPSRPDIAGPKHPSRRWVLLGAVALLIGAAATVHFRAAAPRPDAVEAAEAARRIMALVTLGPLPLIQVAPGDVPAVLAAAGGMPPDDAGTLAADAAAGRVRVVSLSVFDSDVEDGDVAEIRSGGFSQTVRLTKAPVTLAVPVGADGVISVTGLADGGGGGVTVGLALPGGPLPLPPLSVGQTLHLPVGSGR